MPGARLRWILASGLGFFAIFALAQVHAQVPPQPPTASTPVGAMPVPVAAGASQGSVGKPLVLEPAGPPVAMQPKALTPSPAAPPTVPAAGACSCGDRHGVSRWLWHKNQCKRRLQEC